LSQEDCLLWLEEQKKITDRWFSVKEIKEGLKKSGKGNGTIHNVPKHLLILTQWGFIKMRGVGVWKHHKEFRAK